MIFNGGRIACILINFIPSISALNNKHLTYSSVSNKPPSAGQATRLHHFKSVQLSFPVIKNVLISAISENTYTDTNVSAVGQ